MIEQADEIVIGFAGRGGMLERLFAEGESTMKKKINVLLFIGIIGTAIFAPQFAAKYGQAIWGNKDIWWTPNALALPLHETKQEIGLFLSNELLQDHIKRGSLYAKDSQGKSYQVASKDIKIRLNNWNKVKASLLHVAVFLAFMSGVSITCLILGVAQFIIRRKEIHEQAAPPDADQSSFR
jgi:hypothetical protein